MSNLIEQYKRREREFKKMGYDIRAERRYILQKANLTPGCILEVGTGRGYLAAALARQGHTFVSIDIDSEGLKAARQYLRQSGLLKRVTLRRLNAEKLPFKNGAFDSVISSNLFHHLERPRKCLREMLRVTKTKLIIADVNKKGERILQKVHRGHGSSHQKTKMTLMAIRDFLVKSGCRVKTYRHGCQTVLFCQKPRHS